MIIDRKKLSPMMQQYFDIKDKYPDCLILYRLGDFYEMFFDDAIIGSEVLSLTLTGRDCGLAEKAPMCGVPFHAVDNYLSKLVNANIKVAICEQLTKPGDQKGMVERDIVRVVTPGTVFETNILNEKTNNYILSIYLKDNIIAISWSDISTGEFYTYQFEKDFSVLDNFISIINPVEIIGNKLIKSQENESLLIKNEKVPKITEYLDGYYDNSYAYDILINLLKVKNLISFDIEDKKGCISASGALIKYFEECQFKEISNVVDIKLFRTNSSMVLDMQTIRNLELFETLRDKKTKGSLLNVLDKTKTSAGARELKKLISMPLISKKEINDRLYAINALINHKQERLDLVLALTKIRDIERIISKLMLTEVGPRELLSIGQTISIFKEIKTALEGINESSLLNKLLGNIEQFRDLEDEILSAISETSPVLARDGNFINKEYDKELDRLKSIKSDVYSWMNSYENTLREETNIKKLKISYNRIFGYYIEIPKGQISNISNEKFIRKQTTVNYERYTTEELTAKETEILSADQLVLEYELKLFNKLIDLVKYNSKDLLKSINAITQIDILQSLATVAINNGYVMPIIVDSNKPLIIEDGRHPVIENIIGKSNFVMNSTLMDNSDNCALIITGPNMSGKSTYMRQVALIVLLAQLGSFVPASSAQVPIIDRIFTRIGASDDLSQGQSTFMMEMTEMANILKNATKNSLIIIDEIGRGTSTRDGLSIAWATVEYIVKNIHAKTLFSTHYHELTELEGQLSGLKNYFIQIKEIGDTVMFLHKIQRGGASRSFGIEVAQLAGVPDALIDRAKGIAQMIDEHDFLRDMNKILLTGQDSLHKKNTKQLSLFDENATKNVLIKLKEIDLNKITPLEALNLLTELKGSIKDE